MTICKVRDMRVGTDKQLLVDCAQLGYYTALDFCSACKHYKCRDGLTVQCAWIGDKSVGSDNQMEQNDLPF